MSLTNIFSALVTAYKMGGFFPDAETCYPNTKFDVPANKPWVKFNHMPNQPEAFTLGEDGTDYADGLIQLDLNYPPDTGTGDALGKADAMRVLFRVGSRFLYDGTEVIIRSCGSGPGRQVDGFYRVTVTISYYAIIQR